jgi:hypothetical protein
MPLDTTISFGFFNPFEDPGFLETAGLIRFGLKRNTPGKWLRSSRPISPTGTRTPKSAEHGALYRMQSVSTASGATEASNQQSGKSPKMGTYHQGTATGTIANTQLD